MKVIIAGGGIGGLTAAMALHERGIEVQVYESVREVQPLGVGINILPHAMRVFAELGLMELLLPYGVETAELAFFNKRGQLIWREPRGLAAGYEVPQLSVHRGRLQLTLLAQAKHRLGDDAIRTGHAVESFEQDGTGITVHLIDRDNERAITDRADVLIGADGIHSAVRKAFYPDEGRPHWSGNLLWRAVSRSTPLLTGRSMFMAGHLPHKFVAYPLEEPAADGTQLINWIAELNWEHVGLSDRESWNRRGNFEDFAPRFTDWSFDWVDIPALIAAADSVYEFPMVDRDPLPRWTFDRVTLLGDAAHPMYPIGSNGASQAILDARALTDALTEEASYDTAFARYETQRRAATAAIVLSNRQHGPERVMDLAQERAPEGFTDVKDVFEAGELEGISAQYKQLAGFKVPK
jgi:2-polyprenyl-6-methoxyphenol hydroxylase-like FAD-dependent oxidoreductase